MLALLEGVDLCAFWACDGPDEEPVSMKTCRVCWAIHELRKVRALAGVVERGDAG